MSRRIQILLLALIAASTAAGRLHAQESGGGPAVDEVATAPVEIDGTVLFRLRGVSSFPAEDRARAVSQRIVAAAANPGVSIESLRVIESENAKAQGLILHTEIGIGYETPWRQVEAMLLTAAARCASPSEEAPRAFVRLKKLGDFAVTYELNVYCTNIPAMLPMYTAMHTNILDVFNEYGVQIMTPAYEGDPPEPKVVPPKDWFMAPAVPPSGNAFVSAPSDTRQTAAKRVSQP